MRAPTAIVLATALLAFGCGGSGSSGEPGLVREDTVEHVHGLGVNPRDDRLLVATHSGVFRLDERRRALTRVGDLRQDTMGFTVVGEDRILASGHPDQRTEEPPHLGLIESTDAGQTWRPRSLSGEADLHALTANRFVLYAADARSGRLLASSDGGATWVVRRSPGQVVSLAVDPADPLRLVASTDRAVLVSSDGAATWRRAKGIEPAVLTWPSGERLHAAEADGTVRVSTDGLRWSRRGRLAAEPVAVTAADDRLYVADVEGRIFRSSTGGRAWELVTPG